MAETLIKAAIVIGAPVLLAIAILIHKALFWDDDTKDACTPPYCGSRPTPKNPGVTSATRTGTAWPASNLATTPTHSVQTGNDAMTTRHDSVNEVIPGGTLTSASAFTARLAALLGTVGRRRR